ncbi:MAG: cupin domain-containing protein [Bacteroidia bacterium]
MEDNEIKKSKIFIIDEVLDYVPHAVVIKTIIKKVTGNVSAYAFDAGESLKGKISPFDMLIQIIDGKAEIVISNTSNLLENGQSIIIPAHSSNSMNANVRFKMLSTLIKSGYEELA